MLFNTHIRFISFFLCFRPKFAFFARHGTIAALPISVRIFFFTLCDRWCLSLVLFYFLCFFRLHFSFGIFGRFFLLPFWTLTRSSLTVCYCLTLSLCFRISLASFLGTFFLNIYH